MECPSCRLENPPTAQRCDCGHLFGGALRIDRDGRITDGSRSPVKSEVRTFTYKKKFGVYMTTIGWQTKSMDDHMQEMLNTGWQVLQNHSGGGNINVGRTAMRVAALGIPALIFGASRQDETITITFTRSSNSCPRCSAPIDRSQSRKFCTACGAPVV